MTKQNPEIVSYIYSLISSQVPIENQRSFPREAGTCDTTRPAKGRDTIDQRKTPAQKRGHAHGLHRHRRLHHERPRRLRGTGVRDVAVGGVVVARSQAYGPPVRALEVGGWFGR